MPPGALQQQGQRSAGPPKVVGELLKRAVAGPAAVEGTPVVSAAVPVRKRNAASEPAAAAMVLAKDMATGRKSSPAASVGPRSSRAVAATSPRGSRTAVATATTAANGRASSIPVRPKPVTPSVSRKLAQRTTADDGRKQQRPNTCRRPTSPEPVKVSGRNRLCTARFNNYLYVICVLP